MEGMVICTVVNVIGGREKPRRDAIVSPFGPLKGVKRLVHKEQAATNEGL